MKSYSYERLQAMDTKFRVHDIVNRGLEQDSSITDPCDFHKIMKVDNHIHLAAAMTSKHLLTFIREKIKNHGDDMIKTKTGEVTLRDLFGSDIKHLTVDTLDTHRGATFQV